MYSTKAQSTTQHSKTQLQTSYGINAPTPWTTRMVTNREVDEFEAENNTVAGNDVDDVDAEFEENAQGSTVLFDGPCNLAELNEDMLATNEMNIADKTRQAYVDAGASFMEWMKSYNQHAVKDVTIKHIKMYQLHVLKTSVPKQGRTVISASYIASIRTAIKYLFESNDVPLPEGYAEDMKKFGRAMKRKIVLLSAESSDRVQAGKEPMSFAMNRKVGSCLLKNLVDPFSSLFHNMSWNLMCRSNNTSGIRIEHLEAKGDAIGVAFQKTNTNQYGDKPKDTKHVYANPFMPETCTHLSLGLQFLCHRPVGGLLFAGPKQHSRFGQVTKYWKVFNAHSRDPTSTGTHSLRKGAATYCTSGCTSGPSIVAVCLHCDWSMGLQDRYFRFEGAADQYVGRIVAGLPQFSKFFATLSPHFDFSKLSEKELNAILDEVFGPVLQATPTIRPVLAMVLASVVFHRAWLAQNLHPSHMYFNCVLSMKPHLMEKLAAAVTIKPCANSPTLTGVPPYVMQFCQMGKIEESLKSGFAKMESLMNTLRETVTNSVSSLTKALEGLKASVSESIAGLSMPLPRQLDENGDLLEPPTVQAWQQYMTDTLNEAVAKHTASAIAEITTIAEAATRSAEAAEAAAQSAAAAIRNPVQQQSQSQILLQDTSPPVAGTTASAQPRPPASAHVAHPSASAAAVAGITLHLTQSAGGNGGQARFSSLPASWKFPTITLTLGWHMWWGGNMSAGVPVLRLLATGGQTFIAGVKEQKIFASWRVVFENMEKYLRERDMFVEIPNYAEVDEMFERCFDMLEFVHREAIVMSNPGRTVKVRQLTTRNLMVTTMGKHMRAWAVANPIGILELAKKHSEEAVATSQLANANNGHVTSNAYSSAASSTAVVQVAHVPAAILPPANSPSAVEAQRQAKETQRKAKNAERARRYRRDAKRRKLEAEAVQEGKK